MVDTTPYAGEYYTVAVGCGLGAGGRRMGGEDDNQFECIVFGCSEAFGAIKDRTIHIKKHDDETAETAMLDEINRLCGEFGRTPTSAEMDQHGELSIKTYRDWFGTWNNAVLKSGNDVVTEKKAGYFDLIRSVRLLANKLGKCPMSKEMKEQGRYGPQVFIDRLGGWDEALGAAGVKNAYSKNDGNEYIYYGPNWKEQRAATLSRDNNRCRVCSNQHSQNTSRIHVHHIRPAKEFGAHDPDVETDYSVMNDLSNLITLCDKCHPKFDGYWTSATPDGFALHGKAELEAERRQSSST